MFGFFGKKNVERESNDFSLAGTGAGEIAANAAVILELNLMLCRATDEFASKLRSDLVRGYFVGFFDGAAQAAGVKFATDQQFFTYLGVGHMHLLKGDVPDPAVFALDSLALQGTKTFGDGQMLGGSEYFAWTKDKERRPHALLQIFHQFEK